MAAVTKILAALLERERTGRGSRVVISMTHNAHRMASRPILTGDLSCYRIYATADNRWLTVAALEPQFWARLVELLGRPDLAGRQHDENQQALATELAAGFATKTLAEWLDVFDNEDVCVGPVATLSEASGEHLFHP